MNLSTPISHPLPIRGKTAQPADLPADLSNDTPSFGSTRRRPSPKDYARQLVTVSIFYLIGLGFTLRALLFSSTIGSTPDAWSKSRHQLARLLNWFFRLAERWHLLVVDNQLEAGPALPPGTILVANHPGLFDALLLLRQWPDSSCVMRAGLMRSPAFHGAARACGFLPNDSGVEFIREAITRIRQGENLIIFPEGTRTLPGSPLHPFKKGFALVARKSGAPIQTILIEHRGDFLCKGGRLLSPSDLPLQIRLRRGMFLPAPDNPSSDDSIDRLAATVEDYFHQALPSGGFPA